MVPIVRRTLSVALLVSSALTTLPALAQSATEQPAGPTPADDNQDEIIVTAQKRDENIQSVPISIQAIGTRRLDQLNVTSFADYSQLLPSVAFQSSQPGVTTVYMRGVASGGDGNHSGSLPSVGVYLDEQPVTTIGGTPDIHIYDVARIESLAGPQGTLYGASSEAGTIRIITNKPDLKEFYGRVDGELNTVKSGGMGGRLEGMLNIPLSQNAALRVVGFYQHDAGFIDNVPGTRSFIGGITVDNPEFVEKDYNDADLWGGRAALKIDLDDNWTVTPTILYQEQRAHGTFGYDAKVGDLEVQHFFPEYRRDRFIQAALTIEGKVGNWDLTYAGAYFDRRALQSSDYTDYAEAYDSLYASVGGIAGYFYFQNNAGQQIDSRQRIIGTDHFKKMSQELRVASPQDERFRLVAGAFYQHQSNRIGQDYRVADLADNLSVNGRPGTLWLTEQYRVDKDYAVFGEASYDLLPKLTLTAGGRAYIFDNSLIGFFGFGRDFDGPPYNAAGSSRTGVAGCYTTTGALVRDNPGGTLLPAAVGGSPCTNLAQYVGGTLRPRSVDGQGATYRLNLTWKPTDGLMFYGTWSKGFRPGGINRRATVAPYAPDFLINYEAGWKTTLLDGRLRWNGAVYQQNWNAFQFSFLGANSFTEIHNGPDARIRGVESDVAFNLGGLSLTAAGSYTDARIQRNLCAIDDPTYSCAGTDNFIAAPVGTRLPVTPRFKVSGNARYTTPIGSTAKGYVQALVTHQSSASSDIRTAVVETGTGDIVNPAALQGRLAAFTTANFAVGTDLGTYSLELYLQNAFDERAQLSRFQQCGSCFQRPYIVTNTPRTIGIRAGARF
ncbi:TonB-dependent receptor [Sphingomonas sp. Leaf24]|uniref:TonB-dependent receptor n=1 Tax=unclassified Sphingomonas TaxID=196159 RepID=UPI0006F4342D|nr:MULTISPECIES: TonB-dependent receptor [unclassified Sphingomonas]KQM22372.1 TonB-dependent receptor [Sphingomonas sp. Leaf5]KQM93965.1 TonB-dependent receptor [Sphingomonas sp. Leaf24]